MKAGSVDRPFSTALILGVVVGIALEAGKRLVGTVVKPSVLDYTVAIVVDISCFLVIPATISFVAGRRYFWWGFVPALVGVFLSDAVDPFFRRLAFLPISWWILAYLSGRLQELVGVVAGVLISSGPVSLTRYIIQRRSGSAIVREDAKAVDSASKEGAWPPPPAVK